MNFLRADASRLPRSVDIISGKSDVFFFFIKKNLYLDIVLLKFEEPNPLNMLMRKKLSFMLIIKN